MLKTAIKEEERHSSFISKMLVNERVLFGTMNDNNNELLTSLLDKIIWLEAKKRKTLVDYGTLSIYQLIENNLADSKNYKASQPTNEQIEKATDKQKAEYSKLIQLRDIISKFNNQISLADYQLTLFYERVENFIHTLAIGERLETQLANTIGQQQAMEFMAKSNEGLLTVADISSYRAMFYDASYNFGISSQCYIYAFHQWLSITAEQFNMPELALLKSDFHIEATTAIYTAKERIANSIVGTQEEKSIKLNNLNLIYNAIANFTIADFALNKRQLAELKQDVRAFKKGINNTLSFSLYELYIERREKLVNDYIKIWQQGEHQTSTRHAL